MTEKILVVDDSDTVRRQVRAALLAGGFGVIEAADGAEALAHLNTFKDIVAVICDINMPTMNGLQLLEQLPIRSRHIPFVMLTTDVEPTHLRRARSQGARGWLIKPFTPDQLVAAMWKLTARPLSICAMPA